MSCPVKGKKNTKMNDYRTIFSATTEMSYFKEDPIFYNTYSFSMNSDLSWKAYTECKEDNITRERAIKALRQGILDNPGRSQS